MFTDEDLQRLKMELAAKGETTPFSMEALIERLEAAEELIDHECRLGDDCDAMKRWYAAAGK